MQTDIADIAVENSKMDPKEIKLHFNGWLQAALVSVCVGVTD